MHKEDRLYTTVEEQQRLEAIAKKYGLRNDAGQGRGHSQTGAKKPTPDKGEVPPRR